MALGRILLSWRNRRINSAHAADRLSHPNDYVIIDGIVEDFRASGGLSHQFQAYKLCELRKLLAKYSPSSILELGSGTSTAIFSRYIQESNGRLTSVDESSKWLENAKKLSGIENEDKRFEWVVRKPITKESNGKTMIGYNYSPNDYFDFVFIDGPSLRINGVQRKDAINDDVFRIVENSAPKIIVVDARYSTVRALNQALKSLYTCQASDLIGRLPGKSYRYFSVFVLNNPVHHISARKNL